MNIKVLRQKKGLTQSDIAEALCVSQGAVSQWENGIVYPSIEMLKKLAKVLGCTTDEILEEETEN